jgi:protein-S-isoprenylcysteine O-methyltransferase Ste14
MQEEEACMASMRRSVLVSLLFIVFGGPGFVLVYIPYWLTRFRLAAGEPVWQIVLAAALIAAGAAPAFESMKRFVWVGRGTLVPAVPTERLVVSGFYRHMRNPMYTGLLVVLVGEAILFESRHMVLYIATIWLVTHFFIWFYEEPTLTRRYGVEYLLFKKHVPRWIPRPTPWRGQAR